MTESARPTVSIALCTYNGNAYLPAQWQSLLDQKQRPDEVIISDDLSTDGTPDLIQQLVKKAPFPVRMLKNSVRLGSNKNFERALAECTGELIFICDQDDFWLPEKISTLSQHLQQHPATQVAFCDAYVTDEKLTGQQGRFWEEVRFDKSSQHRWQSGEMMEVMLDGNRVMGCAMALRRSFLPIVLPIPDNVPGYIYDGWIALVASALGTIDFVDQPLQLYRTHIQQQIGVREQEAPDPVQLRDRFVRHRAGKLAPLQEKQVQLAQIRNLLTNRLSTDAPGFAQLDRRLAHFTMRGHLSPNRLLRIPPVLNSLRQGNYNRYADASANWYAPYLAVLGDILE